MSIKNSQACPGCGAPVEFPQGASQFFCGYCGSQLEVPAEMVTAIEIVAEEGSPEQQGQHAERTRIEKIHREIAEQQLICDWTETMTLPIAIGLVAPGFFVGFFGCTILASSGKVGYAILCGAICAPIFIIGVTLLSVFSNKKERAESRIKFLQSQLGQDTRSLGEKVIDKGIGWIFGRK